MNLGPIFTPANQLTLARMLLIPAFVILLIYGYRGWALVVFMTAGLTDLLDVRLPRGRLGTSPSPGVPALRLRHAVPQPSGGSAADDAPERSGGR